MVHERLDSRSTTAFGSPSASVNAAALAVFTRATGVIVDQNAVGHAEGVHHAPPPFR